MKTNLPIAVCLIDYFFFLWVYARFLPNLTYKYNYVSFEGLPETSEEGLTLELSAFETLYYLPIRNINLVDLKENIILLYPLPTLHHNSFWKLAPLYFNA